MCGTYGFDEVRARDAGKRRVSFAAADEAAHAERLGQWASALGGTAQITRRAARNLNPLVHEVRGERRMDPGWWWLWVNGSPAPFSAFNSRDDALMRSWQGPFQRRAILPATWYREQGTSFGLDGAAFGIAAITSAVPRPGRDPLLTYSVVTRSGVGDAASVRSSRGEARMPLILPESMHDEWLSGARPGDHELVARAVGASEELCGAVARFEPEPAEQTTPALALFEL